jgi:hypothetical protein
MPSRNITRSLINFPFNHIYFALGDSYAGTTPYSTVLRFIRSLEQQTKEAYIKASYTPGDVCEFDWGEVKLTVDGVLRVFPMAAFTTAYGNYRYAYLFTKHSTECFQEAHARFFEHVGGVHKTLVYDNMKVAVKRFVNTEKEPTDGLLQFSVFPGPPEGKPRYTRQSYHT